jgi:hypothetical protein
VNEQWFRFFGLLVTQGVILIGLMMNRAQMTKVRTPKLPPAQRESIERIETKVDDLTNVMIRHLESHGRRK